MVSKTLIRNVGLLIFSSVISLFILFVIGEFYLGNKFDKRHEELTVKKQKLEKKMSVCFTHSPNTELLYAFIPNSVDSHCEGNSHGYRDYEYDVQKSRQTFRVVVIGDSIAQGYGVELDDTFAKVLEKQLRQHKPEEEYKIEVIIFARAGYSTSQELIVLQQEALAFSPDLIVWSYVLNDPADPLFHNANGDLGTFFYRPTLHTIHWIQREIFVALEKRRGRSCEKEYHELLHCVYWQKVETHINQLGDISKKENIPIFFLIHPLIQKDKSYKEYSLTALHKQIGGVAANAGLIVLDVLDAYQPFHSDDVTQLVEGGYDPWHPNAKGHRIIADYIYDRIREGEYIQMKQGGQEISRLQANGSVYIHDGRMVALTEENFDHS